jgi:hypothetical protein
VSHRPGSAFAATNEGVGGRALNRGGVSTEPQGGRGGWLTYTNSSPSICRSVPLTRDDWRPPHPGTVPPSRQVPTEFASFARG